MVNIFLPSALTYVFGAQKNCLIEMVLLSTHNITLVNVYVDLLVFTHIAGTS